MALSPARKRQIKFNNFCCTIGKNVRQSQIWPISEKQQEKQKNNSHKNHS